MGYVQIYSIDLAFSGEQIFQSGVDGPYTFIGYAISNDGLEDSISAITPDYNYIDFGEKDGRILSKSNEEGIDEDSDGKNEVLSISMNFSFNVPGEFNITASLVKESTTIESINFNDEFTVGERNVTFEFSGYNILNSHLNGPYNIVVNLFGAEHESIDSKVFSTEAYTLNDFEYKVMNPNGINNYYGIDLNYNGKWDFLYFRFQTEVKIAGKYRIACRIVNSTKEEEFVYADTLLNLSEGINNVSLLFPGTSFNQSKYDEPYYFHSIEILDTNAYTLELIITDYQINGYNHGDFDNYSVSVKNTGFFQCQPFDLDLNSYYDILQVDLGVVSSQNGVVICVADLIDDSGNKILSSQGIQEVVENDTSILRLEFDGRYIYGHLRNGPYRVGNAYLYHTGDVIQGTIADTLGFSDYYFYNEFEPTPVVTGVIYDLLKNGQFGAGTKLYSNEVYDFADQNGRYNLIFLNEEERQINTQYYEEIPDTFNYCVYVNQECIGYQNSVTVNLDKYKIDTIDFILPVSIDTTICEGDEFFAQGEFRTESGVYVDTLIGSYGCDSIVYYYLSVLPAYLTTIDTTINEGECYFAGGDCQYNSGTYYDTLSAINNCDSLVITILTVNELPENIPVIDNSSVYIYPTVTSQYLFIDTDEVECYELFDLNGRKFLKSDKSFIDFSAFSEGLYLIRIYLKNKTFETHKIIYRSKY